jgi:hypothetical protein
VKFVPTVRGELIPAAEITGIHRIESQEGGSASVRWECKSRDGRTHRLSGATVRLLTSVVVPAAPGWFIPEELIGGHPGREHLVGISRVPVLAWLVPANGRGVVPLTIDPDIAGSEQPLGSPDGRILLADGSEFDTLDQYFQHLQQNRVAD